MAETLRIHTPGRYVAFGRQDLGLPGYREAVEATRERDFEAVERLAGGRAALFHEETLAFAWSVPSNDPRTEITAHFEAVTSLMQAALIRLGVDAHIGEVVGEYCPGQYSINARHEKKIVGIGQRISGKATHIGGVIVVNHEDVVRDTLVPVYSALDIAWKPDTTGSIADEVGAPRDVDRVADVILDAFAERYSLEPGYVKTSLMTEAAEVADKFLSPRAQSSNAPQSSTI
jgi:lipoate-protein ligase A